jgi:2-methylcitrate dehydratase
VTNKRDDQDNTDQSANETLQAAGVGRRNVLKLGVGAGAIAAAQMLGGYKGVAQEGRKDPFDIAYATGWGDQFQPISDSMFSRGGKPVPGGPPYLTPHAPQHRTAKYGDFMNTSGRSYGNGPMDETSRKIVSFASSFKVELTDAIVKDAIGTMFVDTLGSAIAAFETDSIRCGAKLAKLYTGAAMQSTVWGYGIKATPDVACFVNSCAIRHYDNNSAGQHETDQVSGILAVAEALHKSGPETLTALVLFWEVFGALLGARYPVGAPGDRGPCLGTIDNHTHAAATACACAWLMGLNEDQMANAISLAVISNVSLYIGHWEEPDSMSKSNHDAELCRSGVFAALQARAGITGPGSPFDGAGGLMDVVTGRFEVTLPCRIKNDVDGNPTIPLGPGENEYVVQSLSYKRHPGNGGFGMMPIIPEFREFCKAEEIELIQMDLSSWGDGAGPGKFDPLNDDTADHSIQYGLARALMDGDLFIDAYEPAKLRDPAIRALMAKIYQREIPGAGGVGTGGPVTIKTKSGRELTLKSPGYKERMSLAEIHSKYERHCAYRGLSNAKRDQIRDTWMDIRHVKDISVTIRETLAHYGKTTTL